MKGGVFLHFNVSDRPHCDNDTIITHDHEQQMQHNNSTKHHGAGVHSSRSTDLEVGKYGEDQRGIVGKVRDSWHNQHDIGNYCKGCSRNGKCIDTCLKQSQLQSN